jgi:hypothetical protein
MSVAMAADRALGWMTGEIPPRKIGRRVEEAVGIKRHLSRPAFEASWVAEHFAYGAAAGVGYELLRSKIRMPEPVPAGPAYGAALWAVSYVGLMPMAGLYPPPTEDRPERLGMIFVHHLVYGTALATACQWLRAASAA